jgi:hypothetical protein
VCESTSDPQFAHLDALGAAIVFPAFLQHCDEAQRRVPERHYAVRADTIPPAHPPRAANQPQPKQQAQQTPSLSSPLASPTGSSSVKSAAETPVSSSHKQPLPTPPPTVCLLPEISPQVLASISATYPALSRLPTFFQGLFVATIIIIFK